jgi:hypothetical protein
MTLAWLREIAVVAAVVAGLLNPLRAAAAERLAAGMADGSPPPGQCLFMPGTIVPRLAIGVRRLADEADVRAIRHLELRQLPDASAPVVIRRPLYKPLFVYAEQAGVDGAKWCLLGSDYAVSKAANLKGALGWVDARQLHFLDGRYAYHFKNPDRVRPVHLYQNEADAYAALESQGRRPPEPRPDLAFVAERLEPDFWDPLAPDAIPPFVEMPPRAAAGLTDTTLSFPLAADNRLIRVGAVCGGPVDRDILAAKRQQAGAKAGVEILFVIDDTLSMEKYIQQVADFIEANLSGGGDATDIRLAVSWYRDREDDSKGDAEKPYEVEALRAIEPREVVKAVREHRVRTIKGDGAQARELMGEGLEAAIAKAGFAPGANAMVFVIGDYGDRSAEEARMATAGRIAKSVADQRLQVAFIQVADAGADQSFRQHAGEIADAVGRAGGPPVKVESAGNTNLQKQIAKLQAEMESRRDRLLAEIEDLNSRNIYSQPGPLMEGMLKERGIERQAFDKQHLQFFVPACGWLYHPLNPEGDPQLRELVFVSRPEAKALVVLLATVQEQLKQTGKIDGQAAVNVLAKQLASHAGAADAIRAAWEGVPEAERSLGNFLRDAMGLRVRNPLLYQRAGVARLPATLKTVEMLGKSKELLAREDGPERFWYDSWLVLP